MSLSGNDLQHGAGVPSNARGEGSAVHGGIQLHHPSPLVTNEMGNILRRKGWPLVEGGGHRMKRKLLMPTFPRAHIQDRFLGFDLRGAEIAGKVAGVVRASRSGAGGGEEEEGGWWR